MKWLGYTKLILVPLLLAGCSGVDVLNSVAPRIGVERIADINYSTHKKLSLDIYRPVQNSAIQPLTEQNAKSDKYPVIVFYFGGRWQEGDKSMYQFLGRELASRGFITVIPNYRLWPQVGYQGFLQDSVDAVNWVNSHIDSYGGNQNKVFLMGHSAGAYNAIMLAMNTPYSKGSLNKIAGAIGISGPYDFLPFSEDEEDLKQIFGPKQNYLKSQPINWADGNNAPLLLIHSLDDTIVYPKNSVNLANAIKKQGGAVDVKIVNSLSHPMMIGVVSNILSWKAPVLNWVEAFVKHESMKNNVTDSTI